MRSTASARDTMYRPCGESRSPCTAVEKLRRTFGERPVGLGVSSVGVFLGLLTGVRMYLLPASQWKFELGVVAALAGFTAATGVALAVTDVPVARARRAETLCLKGLGVMGLSTLGLFLVGAPLDRGMATSLCLSDMLLTGGAVGGLGIGMLYQPRPERGTDESADPADPDGLRRQPTDGETGSETEADRETETGARTKAEAEQPREGLRTIRLPIPPHETPESALDAWLEVLADPRCRHVLHYFTRTAGQVATVDELATSLEASGQIRTTRPEQATGDRATVTLHHTVLPKLDEAGVLDYDARTQTVRYHEHPALERWLRAVEPFDED